MVVNWNKSNNYSINFLKKLIKKSFESWMLSIFGIYQQLFIV